MHPLLRSLRKRLPPKAHGFSRAKRATRTHLSIFEYKDRVKKLQVERVMDILGISEGKTVADIGAGSGWFSVRAARRVTPNGLVYALDINPEAIQYIQQRVQREGIGNVRVIRSKPDDPLLPAESIDAVLPSEDLP